MNIQVFLGTVNFTDFLHVTVAKVSNPGVVVWETYIDVPVTNYTFVIEDIDADNYYINFYDAPTDDVLGTLTSQCFVSALSSEYEYELRFYEPGNLHSSATLDETNQVLTDTYLIGKPVHQVEKEGLRTLELDDEYTYDADTGEIRLLDLLTLEEGEKLVVIIKNRVGSTGSSGSGGLYTGTLTVTASTLTLTALDKNKRVRLRGSGSTQVITLPALSALSVDDGYLFDNACGGAPVQVKLLVTGSDRVQYSGFMTGDNQFAEFWVSAGETLLLRKFDDDYWEVIGDYKGIQVGERFSATYNGHPGALPEDGRLLDGDEYPRLWWWLQNVLPSTHKVVTDTVTSLSYEHPASKPGLFVVHSTLKKFRLPNTQELSERGMFRFEEFGTDDDRDYDYPGGYQSEMVGPHVHTVPLGDVSGQSDNANDRAVMVPGTRSVTTANNTGIENRVKNFGVIFMRKI